MTFDLAQAVITAGALMLGYLIGRARGRRRHALEQPPPICPCGHAVGFHTERTGACQGQEEHRLHTAPGDYHDEMTPCGCQHYSGPELVSTITLQPITMRPTTTRDE